MSERKAVTAINRNMARANSEVHDCVGEMMAWEEGTLSYADEVKLFQRLINSGLAWQLQGCYGRHAAELIAAGECHVASHKNA